ncbi:MAG: AarF/ABC1/UbiB kinase family protein [Syntrophomonadaceae bacterium]|nr:AarF/ABC1/UbiB kinase family protein [Syntrophomonadaceae bacterium]
MRQLTLVKRYKHIGRYREIVNVLARHGFGFIIDQAGLRGFLSRRSLEEGRQAGYLTPPQRMLRALEELGPTFVKLGQILSTRPDLVPRDYLAQLEKLQDQVPPFPFEQVEELLRRELDGPWERVFARIEREPLASASIGQVHRAWVQSGESVVIKVQRPGVDQLVETDIEILFDVARLLEARTSWGKHYGLVAVMEEFAHSLAGELDYAREGRNADRLSALFAGDERVVIPRVYWEFSTRRLLTMEYVEAIKISSLDRLREEQIDLPTVARNLVESVLRQIYEFGFFHTDPHPGNLGVLPGGRLVYMDFGQVGRLDEAIREKAVNLILAMVRYDVDSVLRSLLDIGVVQHRVDRAALRRDLARLQEKYYGMPLAEIQVGEALRELVELSFVYNVRIPSEFAMAIKCLITTEGVLEQLDPQISMLELAENFARQVLRRRLEPSRIRRSLTRVLLETLGLAQSLPRRADNVLGMMEEGEIKLQLEHHNLRPLVRSVNTFTNRLALSILIGSLVIGSSFIARTADSFLRKIPIAEIVFVAAAAVSIWLILSIVRSGRY